MNRHFILAGLLSLALISPAFAEDAGVPNNDIQNKTQVQKEFKSPQNYQKTFYEGTKGQKGDVAKGIQNDKFQKPNKDFRAQGPRQDNRGQFKNGPKGQNINDRMGQRPPQFQNRYGHSPQRFANRPNQYGGPSYNRYNNHPQYGRRNPDFQHNRGYNRMSQRPCPRGNRIR